MLMCVLVEWFIRNSVFVLLLYLLVCLCDYVIVWVVLCMKLFMCICGYLW